MKFDISETFPSSLIADFNVFLNYLEKSDLKLTKSRRELSRKNLFQLNQLMTEPQEDVNERSDQHKYPMLHLFYLLLINGAFASIDNSKRTSVKLDLDTEKFVYFRNLNPTEQYFYLFKTFFQYCDLEDARPGEKSGSLGLMIVENILGLLASNSPNKWIEKEQSLLPMVFNQVGFFIRYLGYFGLCSFVASNEENYYASRGFFPVAQLRSTLFGVEMCKILLESRPLSIWNECVQEEEDDPLIPMMFFSELNDKKILEDTEEEEDETEIKEGAFEDAFRPLFQEGTLGEITVKSFRPIITGEYIFKVWIENMPKVWRRVRLSEEHDLDDLHRIIQRSFKFDNDHLLFLFP